MTSLPFGRHRWRFFRCTAQRIAISVPAAYLLDFWRFLRVDRSSHAPNLGINIQAGADCFLGAGSFLLISTDQKPCCLYGDNGFGLIEVFGIPARVEAASELIGNRLG